jgi:PAS domain S-box-containing protein
LSYTHNGSITVISEAAIVKAKKPEQRRPAIGKRTIHGQKATGSPKGASRQGMADSEDKFKIILDAAADAIVVFDREGKIFYWNRAAEKLFGYKAKEVAGAQLELIIPERYRDDYRNALESLKKERRPRSINQSFESEAINKNRKEFPIAASVSTTQIDGGWYFVGIVRDITSLRAAQRSLGDSLAKYQLMYENQRDGIVLVDMKTQQFLEVNQAATEIYGYSKDEMLRMRIVDVFAEEDRDAGLTPESATKLNIFKHKRKDGSVFPAEITGCALMWKNRKIFCAILRDTSAKVVPDK